MFEVNLPHPTMLPHVSVDSGDPMGHIGTQAKLTYMLQFHAQTILNPLASYMYKSASKFPNAPNNRYLNSQGIIQYYFCRTTWTFTAATDSTFLPVASSKNTVQQSRIRLVNFLGTRVECDNIDWTSHSVKAPGMVLQMTLCHEGKVNWLCTLCIHREMGL